MGKLVRNLILSFLSIVFCGFLTLGLALEYWKFYGNIGDTIFAWAVTTFLCYAWFYYAYKYDPLGH